MFLYGKMAITVGMSLYTTRLILGSLGAADFGVFNLVGGAIAMLGFLNASMAAATMRFIAHAEGAGDRAKLREIFNVGFFIHLGLSLLVGLMLYGAGYIFFDGFLQIPPERLLAARWVYYFMILSTMVTVTSVPYDAVLNARENMLVYSIVGVGEALLKLGVALAVVRTAGDKLITYGWLTASVTVVVLLTYRIYCHRKYDECRVNYRYFNRKMFREMFAFSGWSFVLSTASMVTVYGMGVVLNRFFGAVLNTAQGIANQINGQLAAFSNTMLKALHPTIVKSEGAGDKQTMHRAVMTGAKVSFFLNALLFVPFIVEADYILALWLKNVPQWTAIFSRLIMLQTLVTSFIMPLNSAVNATGNLKNMTLWHSASYCLVLPFIWLLFRAGCPPYAMYLTSIAFMVVNLGIVIRFAHRQCGVSIGGYLMRVVAPCLAVVAMSGGVGCIPRLLMAEGWVRLTAVLALFWLAFTVFALYLGFDTDERRTFMAVVRRGMARTGGKI
jgi:O-antigen/teichoic acid export membrane protein